MHRLLQQPNINVNAKREVNMDFLCFTVTALSLILLLSSDDYIESF
jgi:hypothetical protein